MTDNNNYYESSDFELAITTQRNTIDFNLDKLARFYNTGIAEDRKTLHKKQAEIIKFIKELEK